MRADLKKVIESEMNKSVKEKHLNEELDKIEGLIKSCRQIKRYYDENVMSRIVDKLDGIVEGIEMAIKCLK